MKKALFIGAFVFSVVLNLAVAGTIAWHRWALRQVTPLPAPSTAQLNPDDRRAIAGLWRSADCNEVLGLREQVMRKKAEVLELIAANPGDVRALDQKVQELAELRAQMERRALTGISRIMAELPPEKRSAFLGFLKGRACMGMGMGQGYRGGRHMRWRNAPGACPVQSGGRPD